MTPLTTVSTGSPEGILLAIAGTLIIILLGIVGYFISQKYSYSQGKEERLTEAIESLKECVNQLGKTVAKIESGILAQSEVCKLKHDLIDEKIKNLKHENP